MQLVFLIVGEAGKLLYGMVSFGRSRGFVRGARLYEMQVFVTKLQTLGRLIGSQGPANRRTG